MEETTKAPRKRATKKVVDAASQSLPTANPGRQSLSNNQKILLVLAGVIIVLVLGMIYLFMTITKLQPDAPATSTGPSPEVAAELGDDESAVLEQLSRHMLLPEEVPSIATIVDVDTLIADQSFYVGSQNGDQLILYPQSQRAIIYSPARDIIVNAVANVF